MYVNICPECGRRREAGRRDLPTVEKYEVCRDCESAVFSRFHRYEQFKQAAAMEAATSGVPLSVFEPHILRPLQASARKWRKTMERQRRNEGNPRAGLDVKILDWILRIGFWYAVHKVVVHYGGWAHLYAQVSGLVQKVIQAFWLAS